MKNIKYFITISNDFRFFKTQYIFDKNIDINISQFEKIKKELLERGIQLTGDYREDDIDGYIYFNIPYLTFKYWFLIISNIKSSFLFFSEPAVVNPFNYFKCFHIFFKKIFIFDKSIEGTKYIQSHYFQSSVNINTQAVSFSKKKFLVLINANKLPFILFRILCLNTKSLYEERIAVIEYFEKNKKLFDLYGKGWNKIKKYNIKERLFGFKKYSNYKGFVEDKNELLSNYKFCICFENSIQPGYITEKIFDCFKARCVPIYWGAPDISSYIPENCFIDFRKFSNFDEMVEHLELISEDEYIEYVKNIELFLYNPDTQKDWFETQLMDKILTIN